MAYHKLDKKKYAAEQKEKLDELHARITEIGEGFNLSPETLADYYSFAGRFYQYSPRNNMLIYDQNKHATFCGSYKYYQDQGYSVKAGEHGLKILVPVTTTLFKVSENEWKKVSEATKEEKEKLKRKEFETRMVQNYKIGSVFDISQTTIPPEEYPKFYSVGYKSEQHATIFEGVKNYCENELNCPVKMANLHSIGLQGHYLPFENKIELNEILEDSKKLEIALHEMGHAIMHSDVFKELPREQIEFEADSIGLMFSSHFGFDFAETQKFHLAQQYRAMKEGNEEAVENNKKEPFDADPPWQYKVYSKKGAGRSAESHYPTMNIDDICNLPISEIADKNATLFLWVTFPNLKEAFDVIKAWGFTYKTVAFTWIKQNKRSNTLFWGMGYWTRANAEICLLATKGTPQRKSAAVHQVIISHIEQHSKKPDETRDRIVQLMGNLPRIELFARQRAKGWDAWGNEIDSDIEFISIDKN